MSKRDALRHACEYIIRLAENIDDCEACPLYNRDAIEKFCDKPNKNCIKLIKQHFQQQADIPDGWETVKELCENLKKDIAIFERVEFREYRGEKSPDWKFLVVNFCNNMIEKLQQAGIEEE